MNLKQIVPVVAGQGYFWAQVMFSVGYVGTCEVINLMGPRNLGVCEARWATVLALWCPSGLQRGLGAASSVASAVAERRKGLFGS